jgi:hypothetical protein
MRTTFTRKEHQDSAMALMLILMLVYFKYRQDAFLLTVSASLLLTMIAPLIFYPFTIIWLNLSHYLGIVSSFLLLSIIFILFVTPVGFLRRLSGKDPLALRKFRKGTDSVFIRRKYLFTKEDLSNPF